MGYVKGEAPGQSSLFPPSLDELVPEDHPVRVIAAFVEMLDLGELGFERSEAPAMGRPAYDPADLLKLYLYGYLNRIRSSRRLERECARNVEVMWLLGRLAPDFKTVADFRRRNGAAFVRACRAFVAFCRKANLLGADLVAIDGSKFRAVSSKKRLVTARALEEESRRLEARIVQYLKGLEEADREERDEPLDRAAVVAALQELRAKKANCETARAALKELGATQHVLGETDARLMRSAHGQEIAYNVQSAVDGRHGLIVHHEVTNEGADNRQLEPIAKAAQQVLDAEALTVVADAGYFNQSQFAACEEAGITPYVALNPGLNTQGEGNFYPAAAFRYDSRSDSYRCLAGKVLVLKQIDRRKHCRVYAAQKDDCASCVLKRNCTKSARRFITRHDHIEALERMVDRLARDPGIMKRRKAIAEHPFAQIKCWVMGDGRLLLKGLQGARTEMALAVMARNLRRVMTVLGTRQMMQRMAKA